MPSLIHFRAHLLWAGLAVLLAACSPPETAKPPPASKAVLELAAADVVRAETGALQPSVVVTGQLRALERTTVQAEVAARVERVLVREGDDIRAGQLLALLSVRELEARVRQAEAALASARAQAVLADAVRDRQEALRKEQFVSDLELTRGAAEARAAAEMVKAQEALLSLARKSLEDARITAPISGVLARRQVEPGQTVSLNTPLFDIVDLGRLELEITVPAGEIARVRTGQSVQFRVSGYETQFQGTVSRINPVAESGSRALTVYVLVPNPGRALKAGLFAEGKLALGEAVSGVLLPLAALRSDGTVPVVHDKRLDLVPVRVLVRDDRSGQMLVSGIKPGDLVVTTRLADGAAGLPVKMAE
ncbi:RND family efflux transporter MFP subunit [Fluviicoccus keumensis]|uniref:RND family efflux transporter MFP subunit n=1 Tax=Fluviicoccus keumensis TaxID=1435465 RepID=A0A4Q7Z8V5_9GAMM|nr:efflux RND transporter periplasmic adaptor subunit [Fluviicoccus keumensis]RZU46908.1 RND family efflux transporter MFP subunit [Fluviicoccus keumensis]